MPSQYSVASLTICPWKRHMTAFSNSSIAPLAGQRLREGRKERHLRGHGYYPDQVGGAPSKFKCKSRARIKRAFQLCFLDRWT
mmetsp:Transcript_52760/g.103164  ORF Transcript_52760/g.103164 Transcript_52760/m.103164 type:complete len:83 (+) Transcript_52760:228-476(+)